MGLKINRSPKKQDIELSEGSNTKKLELPKPERGFKLRMSKAERKELAKMVKDLPQMKSNSIKEWQTVSGLSLISAGINEVNGEKVRPSKTYKRLVPMIINHRTEAEKAFKLNGMEGVRTYALQIKQRNEECQKEMADSIAKMGLEGKLD